MKIYLRRFIAPAAVLLLWNPASIGAETPTTFVLTVSLPTSTMHVGEDLVVEETLSNPTDHIVVAGEGGRIGLAVELINEKGDDIGLHAMGIPGGKIVEPAGSFISSKLVLRPGNKEHYTLRFKPEPGYLLPGVYRLRVHQRDMKSEADVYSNLVELTVIP